MASSTKVLCFTCNKGKGIFKCEGCSQIFCPKHSIDHRNDLSKQLEEIEITYDIVQQTLIQQTEDPRQHPLLKKIDQWEKESIDKIHRAAEDVRNELLVSTAQHTTQVKQQLQQMSNDLRQGREENDFSEIDLRQWIEKLEELNNEVLNPNNITIREDSTALISNIRIDRQDTSDVFERVCGDARTEENGRLAVKDDFGSHTEIRGKNEYNTGRHTLQFRIEQLTQGGWIFFGIISKSEPMRAYSYSSPSNYGWATAHHTYVSGQNIGGQTIEMIEKDIITLLIDCNQRKIELKNERSNLKLELPVDINKCSFPWQFHLNLCTANTRVRILHTHD